MKKGKTVKEMIAKDMETLGDLNQKELLVLQTKLIDELTWTVKQLLEHLKK